MESRNFMTLIGYYTADSNGFSDWIFFGDEPIATISAIPNMANLLDF